MRVVLDTNVLLSGTFWTGASFKVLQLADSGKITIIISKDILAEFDRVVNSEEILEKAAYREEKAAAIQTLLALSEIVTPAVKIRAVKDDPDDDKFLEAAIEGDADFIISRDAHLLSLKTYEGIAILTPQEYLDRSEKTDHVD